MGQFSLVGNIITGGLTGDIITEGFRSKVSVPAGLIASGLVAFDGTTRFLARGSTPLAAAVNACRCLVASAIPPCETAADSTRRVSAASMNL